MDVDSLNMLQLRQELRKVLSLQSKDFAHCSTDSYSASWACRGHMLVISKPH